MEKVVIQDITIEFRATVEIYDDNELTGFRGSFTKYCINFEDLPEILKDNLREFIQITMEKQLKERNNGI